MTPLTYEELQRLRLLRRFGRDAEVARAVGISERTLYRAMSGQASPRTVAMLRRWLETAPEPEGQGDLSCSVSVSLPASLVAAMDRCREGRSRSAFVRGVLEAAVKGGE